MQTIFDFKYFNSPPLLFFFLRIENSPSATLKHPAKSESSIKLVCVEPYSLHLKLFQKKAKRELKDENIVKVSTKTTILKKAKQ